MTTTTRQATLPIVMLIDDDRFGLVLLTDLLDGCTETTKVCHHDPREAIAWLENHPADLVITDYDMPGFNGIELIKRVRHRPATADVPILMITAIDDPAVRLAALDAGASDFITKPFQAPEVSSRVRNMLALQAAQRALRDRNASLAAEVANAVRSITAREHEIVHRLARAAEYRDTDTASHLHRMAEYTAVIAREMLLPAALQEALFLAAPMHDVGKIGIPDYIMRKPTLLEPMEFEIMQTHTVIGHQILEGSTSDLLQLAGEIALTHHERWDGSGYPNQLSGEEIPLGGRIVAVADVFDALVTRRPYKAAWELAAAFDYIEKNSGVQFDPRCVEALRASEEEIRGIRNQFDD